MLFSFLPSVPLGLLKITTVLVVLTALIHELLYAVKHVTGKSATLKAHFVGSSAAVVSTTDQETAGACLLVKDDNDLLFEWIAYHYTVLPLRYLVVGIDVNSTQNPADVLDLWKGTDLQYWTLNSTDFAHRYAPTATSQQQPMSFATEQERKDYHHHALVERQKGFITTCATILKEHGVRWTTFIDTDEFVVPNVLTPSDKNLTINGNTHDSIRNESLQIRKDLIRPVGEATLVPILNRIQQRPRSQQSDSKTACYTMPRLIVGSLENQTCPQADQAKTFSQSLLRNKSNALSTLRFVQHAKKGDFKQNKFGKVFMDLSRISRETLQQDKPLNIHRPYRDMCGPGAVHFPDAAFYINHYIGSWERYSSRADGRRNRQEWEERAYYNEGTACETRVEGWLERFVEIMGDARASALLGAPPQALR